VSAQSGANINRAAVAISSSGVNNLIVAPAAATTIIRVVFVALVANAAVNIKFQSHTTPTDLTGLFYLAANGGFVLPYNEAGWFATLKGEALDANLSGAQAVGGVIGYITHTTGQ
jgi:isoaspartyl peptidase/L-asparaginase-like protein (Ntn-hydrolase superfamily)